MENELLKKVITLVEITDTEKAFKIKADDNRTYTVWKTKTDGTATKAMMAFETQKMKAGDKFGITYKDDVWNNSEGKAITSHTIVLFDDANDIQFQAQNLPKPTYTPSNDNKSDIITNLAIIKSMLEAGKDYVEIERDYLKYVDLAKKTEVKKELPKYPVDIEESQEMDMSNIPF